jgi:hypothetical protein
MLDAAWLRTAAVNQDPVRRFAADSVCQSAHFMKIGELKLLFMLYHTETWSH